MAQTKKTAPAAGIVSILAWIGISIAWGWLAWRWWQDREAD